MKLSLRWICDHLKIDWKQLILKLLLRHLIQVLQKIENIHTYSLDISDYSFGVLQKQKGSYANFLFQNGMRLYHYPTY